VSYGELERRRTLESAEGEVGEQEAGDVEVEGQGAMVGERVDGEKWCRTNSRTDHCECFVVPLHRRLTEWVPGDMRYCRVCKKFTRRVKREKMRCEYHLTVSAFFGLVLM
jgi:hypothetical protein